MRLHIRYNIGDLIKFNAGDGMWEDYAVVTKVDPWFMGKKAGIQAEEYAIEVIWQRNMTWGRQNIGYKNDPFEIISKAKTNV
jgi:hypothetical protein